MAMPICFVSLKSEGRFLMRYAITRPAINSTPLHTASKGTKTFEADDLHYG